CQGPDIAYTLDESEQQDVAFRLVTGETVHCMLFGGTIKDDVSCLGNTVGMFNAVDAPAPATCPGDPTSCLGQCGRFAGACFCDSLCTDYGDCCYDYESVCS